MALELFKDARGNLFKFTAEEARRRGLRPYTDKDKAADQAAVNERAEARKARVGTPSSKMMGSPPENKGG